MKWRRRRDEELDEELQAHIALEVKQRMDAGESKEEAEAAARRLFGNALLIKEVTRATWKLPWLDSISQDLRYAWRGMCKTPGFTAVVVLILALGIGANTTIFSAVQAAILRPLPFENSDQLVRIWATRNGAWMGGPSALDAQDFAAASRSFEDIVVYDHWRKNVSGIAGSNQAEETVIGLVPGSYFRLLRIRPILGRTFTQQESVYGNHFVAAISSRFWRSRFQSDPAVIGKSMHINAESYTIIAVMPDVIPPWMDEAAVPISVWTPFASEGMWAESARGNHGNYSLGRLKPGVSLIQATAELNQIAGRLAHEHPLDEGVGAAMEPLADSRSGPVRPILLMLSAAVAIVLLITCANLASLLLARHSARSREIAVRAALGASRGRIVRQLLLEAFVLALTGGVTGAGLSFAAGYLLSNLNTGRALPYTSQSNLLGQYLSPVPELRVLLFSLGIAVLTTFLFGLIPAFSGSRVSLTGALGDAVRGSTAGAGRQRLRRLLVITEVALSLVLVVSATMLVQTLLRLERRDPGFRPDHLLLAHIYVPPARYPDPGTLTRFCEAFRQRLETLPGVIDATVTTGYPPTIGWRQYFSVPGTTASRIEDVPTARFAAVDTHYLHTLGLSLLSGRDFAETDTPTGRVVAVVNQAFVRQYFLNRDAVGQVVHQGPPPGMLASSLQAFGGGTRDMTIIGVVGNFMNDGLAMPPTSQIFMLFRQQPSQNFGFKDIAIRTQTNPESIVSSVSRELRALDPDIPLGEVRTMEQNLRNGAADTRLTTSLLSLFAALGTILSLVGVYGVVAYLVAQRTSEFGIRVALGASKTDIVWLVLRSSLFIGAYGVIAGLVGTLAVRSLLARWMFEAAGLDPVTTACAAVLLFLVVVVAGALPVRRALHVDPATALRGE